MDAAAVDPRADRENAAFWEMICGSNWETRLGITDSSPASLRKFDDYYRTFYPYLEDWLDPTSLAGRDVLEVGLGYGTVGQMIAAAGANYSGLDVARAPVELMNRRLQTGGYSGRAVQGSVLDAPFPAESFDVVVSIGCLHHTGDVHRAVGEATRMLRPGGRLVMMVYHAYSYQTLARRRAKLVGDWLRDRRGAPYSTGDEALRAVYDANAAGEAAPHTVFLSHRQLTRTAERHDLTVSRIGRENFSQRLQLGVIPRNWLLATFGKWIGSDLYAVLEKPSRAKGADRSRAA